MSETSDNKLPETKSSKSKQTVVDSKKTDSNSKSKSIIPFSFIVPILLLAVIATVFIFINNRLDEVEQKLNQSNQVNSSASQSIDNQFNETLSRFTSVQKKLDELDSKQEMLTHSLSKPEQQQIHINKDYALAEIEHLLIIASYNLQLGHDVAAAISAMESAGARLTGFIDPDVLSVREQLIADMNELRSVEQADLSGLGLFLSDLINRVDDLALKENIIDRKPVEVNEPNIEQVNGIKHFFSLVWKELKSLVVITRGENISKARLLPEEIYFLRANLKLELANARFAVFNRDMDNLNASIDHIQKWLNGYFDLSDAAVSNIYDSLSSMKKLELAFPQMDISSSLESVRALIRSQDENDTVVNEEEINLVQ